MRDGMAEVTATVARDQFGEQVTRASYAHEATWVTRRGRRVAAIVPVDVPQAWEAAENAEDVRLFDESMSDPGDSVPWEQVKAELGL
jgi:antitoxin (DNA-binding transcriptional repressor) of toxin-antitoxin stability system